MDAESTHRCLSYRDLVGRLTDLSRLATRPEPGERTGTFTSYDRASTYDADSDTYVDWGANADGSGFVRETADGVVIFDADGPGVIWRVWSALPAEGHLRIFVDGGDDPVFDRPFREFFDTFADERSPANFPSLNPTLSRGRNSWIPIPYREHATMVLAPGWGSYYHVSYSTFPTTWQIPSFDGTVSTDAAIALAEADRALSRRAISAAAPNAHTIRTMADPGRVSTLLDLRGPSAITSLRLRLPMLRSSGPERQAELLRRLTLRMTWDDAPQPAVWAPLGDFFGSAPGVQPFETLPLGCDRHEFRSSWYMPFSRAARIELGNDDGIAHQVELEVAVTELDTSTTDGLLRFHARWHRGEFADLDRARFEVGRDRWPDWPLLLAGGAGRFCGAHLHVYNAWHEPAAPTRTWWYGHWDEKTIDWWWGEGDEKFFVDGELFPSTFGTGSEDWVGYAWAAEPPFPTFDSAFAAQPFVEIDANGHTSVSRFHIADDIAFHSSFAGFLEKYKADVWDATNACLYAATAYWYGEPGSSVHYREYPAHQRWGFYSLD